MRHDVLVGREGKDGKTHWTKLGAMFENRSGAGYSIVLDAMPAPQDGQFRMVAFEPKERDSAPKQQNNQQGGSYDPDNPQF